jgi:hypothetical protein
MCIDSIEYKSIFNGHGLQFSFLSRAMERIRGLNASIADKLKIGYRRICTRTLIVVITARI